MIYFQQKSYQIKAGIKNPTFTCPVKKINVGYYLSPYKLTFNFIRFLLRTISLFFFFLSGIFEFFNPFTQSFH